MSHADALYRPSRPPVSATLGEYAALLTRSVATAEPPQSHNRVLACAAGPVLLLPGICRGDSQTRRLRSFLDQHGYRSFGWELGTNLGPTRRLMQGAAERLEQIHRAHGPVNLVGHSMGGLFCRWLAHQNPARVRQVITVCSPFRSAIGSFHLPLRPVLPLWPQCRAFTAVFERPLPVPGSFLYSKDDGMVAWASCYAPDQPDDCFEITGPHVTAASNPAVWAILLQRLQRPLG